MAADVLLERLNKVKRNGKGQWVACCPAHQDRSPSMTIAETEDGRVLLHCFAGCDVESILGAVGLDFDALFPPKPIVDGAKPSKLPFIGVSVLEALAFEALVVASAATMMRNGETLSADDFDRLLLAAERMQGAVNHVA